MSQRESAGVLSGRVTSTSPLRVVLDGSSTPVPSRWLAGYTPAVSDRVLLVATASELVILDRIV